MLTYKCPNGHQIYADDMHNIVCHDCEVIATHIGADGVVRKWTDIEEYQDAARELQDQLDSAFDNQYFSGGW